MGYQRKTYHLVFADPDFEGLEVRTRGAAIEHLVTFQALVTLGSDLVKPENQQQRDDLYELLAGRIIDWNLEDDDGQPVKCTVEALRDQDWPLVLAIGHAWMRATAGVSRPLEPDSPDGEPYLEGSIPMETSSSSPPS